MTQAYYLGFDAETTGINPADSILLEIRMIAYDDQLRPLESWSSLVNADSYADYRANGSVVDVVDEMHTKNGLWDDLAHATEDTSSAAVEALALAWIKEHNYHRLPMLGSSITLDRSFLSAEMPQLLDAFHYQSVDATSLCLLAENTVGFMPADYLEEGSRSGKSHRVLADIERSAALIRENLKGMKANL